MILRRNRLASALAILAMALQAFWPLIAQARPTDPSLRVPVCTIDGTTHYLELPSGKTPLDQKAASHGEHCKLCLGSGDRVQALVSVQDSLFQSLTVASDASAIPPVTEFRCTSASPALPRAPPVS